MADISCELNLRFDGLDAEAHELDLFALGESLQGVARIAATAGHFAATGNYSRYFKSHEVRVMAREPQANCFSMDLVWNFVQQYKILSGSFGLIVAAVIPYIFSRSASRREEMKQLKDSLDKAIEQLGTRDEATVNRLLDIVEKMSSDLRPAVRHAVSPIGNACKTMTITTPERSDTFDEADKDAINASEEDEITETREFTILITEMDLERGSCKVHISGEAEDKRVSSVITDPILKNTNNPYSTAFASEEQMTILAKALIKKGEVARLYISDLSI